MSTRRIRAAAVGVAALLLVVGLAGCSPIVVTRSVALAAPDASATDFAEDFSMDEQRVAVTARLGGEPVVYVFDRTATGWAHSATLTPGPGASSLWGREVAISGDTLAIADGGSPTEEVPSAIEIHDLGPGGWTRGQVITAGVVWDWPSIFTLGLSGDGLLVHELSSVCDQSPCPASPWGLYQRASGTFRRVDLSGPERQAELVSIGVDRGRVVLGGRGFGEYDDSLMAWDATVHPAPRIIDETSATGGGLPVAPYAHVDLAGELMAYVSCCTGPSPAGGTVFIRRDAGGGYAPEASFPSARTTAAISVLPEAVLVADRAAGGWHTFVRRDGVWQHGNEIAAPDAVAGTFAVPPVAAGNDIAVRGDGVLWILTIDPGGSSAP